ncbi:hypothetical protein PC129_g21458 [Phytophthora cactorum]|uniref:Uncharacterized protein n=1 Tax=Phytophthora cactorum TaxID=29920 RepID=A0A8T1H5P7_9STRA|nr:hypothetical protein PC129_g21458 [Phytophthora cactorum]
MAGQMIHVKRNIVKNAWTGNRFSWSMDNKNTCPLCVEAIRVTGCARTSILPPPPTIFAQNDRTIADFLDDLQSSLWDLQVATPTL